MRWMRWLPLAFSLMSGAAVAYPIEPQTLWALTQRADVIVVAQVEGTESGTGAMLWSNDRADQAVLRVSEVLRGEGVPARLKVDFERDVVCPAPPVFEEGRTLVAFLTNQDGHLEVDGLSYGTRYPNGPGELQALTRAVRRAAALQAKHGTESDEARQRWAIEFLAERATRWDALFELDSSADRSHGYYRRERSAAARRASPDAALGALEVAFAHAPSYDRTLPVVLRLLAGRPGASVTQAAADAVEAILQGGPAPYWLDETLDLLEARLGSPRASVQTSATCVADAGLDVRAREVDAVLLPSRLSGKAYDDSVQRRWDALKRSHGLTTKVRDDYERPARTRTGAQTPL